MGGERQLASLGFGRSASVVPWRGFELKISEAKPAQYICKRLRTLKSEKENNYHIDLVDDRSTDNRLL